MTTKKIYRYKARLQVAFPEGLTEIKFIDEIDGFNYLLVTDSSENQTTLPSEFEEAELPNEFLKSKRNRKYSEAESHRKDQQFRPVTYQSKKFSTSQIARQNILEAIEVMRDSASSASCYWQDVDGNACQLSYSDFKNLLKEILARDSKFYFIEAEIKNSVKSTSEITSLESLNVQNLWDEQMQKYNPTMLNNASGNEANTSDTTTKTTKARA
mgnify:CR=1 FL=1